MTFFKTPPCFALGFRPRTESTRRAEALAEGLEQLARRVRDGRGYNADDARDEIARAIENRARHWRKEAKNA